jgi:CheY-like chemotaxis protein
MASESPGAAGALQTLLLVEDNPNDEALTLRALAKADVACRVVVVRDGVEALDYLLARGGYADRDPADLPTVVLLDIRMPRLDGMEVLERLRDNERTRLLPVVVLTSSDEEGDRRRSYRLGANSYVCKPVALAALTDAVQQVGVYWLRHNQPPPPARRAP